MTICWLLGTINECLPRACPGLLLCCLPHRPLSLVVPFYIPVSPAFSDSYLFGFNNRAALMLTLALFAVVGFLSWSGRLRLSLVEPQSADSSYPDARQPSRPALSFALLLATSFSAVFFFLIRSSNGVGEGVYFLDRLGLLAQGLHPYRDFEFAYGPLQIFGPWLFSSLFHLSLTAAYALFWLVSTCLGLLALWFAVLWIDLPAQGKSAAFALFALVLGVEILSSGLNYNPLRYAAPIACLIAVHRLSRRANAPLQTFDWQTILASALAATLLLCLSPEMGVTFCIAVFLYLPICRRACGRPWTWFALSLALAFTVLLLAAARIGVFETMKGFSAGGFSLPVLPGPHILIFLAAFAIVLVYLMNPRHRARLMSSTALLAFYSLGMLPAAFGRCDWAHVSGYELGILLPALLLLTPNAITRRLSRTALLLVFSLYFFQSVITILGVVAKVQLYPALAHGEPTSRFGKQLVQLTERSMRRSYTQADASYKLDRIRAVARLSSTDPHVLFPTASQILYAPFGYSPQRLSNIQSSSIAEGRFMGTLNLLTAAQVRQKIDEMQTHPERDLLVSPDGLEQCATARGSSAQLRALFLLPLVPPPRHESDLMVPLCQYIERQYRIITPASPKTADYALWRYRSPAL